MSRTRVLLAAFLAFAIVVGIVRSRNEPRGPLSYDPRVTSTNSQPRGARALSLWLREFDRPTRSWREPLTSLTHPEIRALFLIDPAQDLTEAQVGTLLEWVTAGGTLFVAPGVNVELERRLEELVELSFDKTAPAEVHGDRAVPDDGLRWRYREATPHERGQFDWPVREIAFFSSDRVSDPSGEHSILFTRDGKGLVAEIWHGDGGIVLFAAPEMLTNHGIDKADNVELIATLVSSWVEPGVEVWFDDYDQGLRRSGSLEGYLAHRRPGLFAAALLSVSFLAVLRYGRGLVVRGETRARRRDPTEFVDALGGLYGRSRAVGPAWSATARVARRVLGGTWRTPRVEPEVRALRARRLRTAIALGERRGGPGETELDGLAKALADALAPPRPDDTAGSRSESGGGSG